MPNRSTNVERTCEVRIAFLPSSYGMDPTGPCGAPIEEVPASCPDAARYPRGKSCLVSHYRLECTNGHPAEAVRS